MLQPYEISLVHFCLSNNCNNYLNILVHKQWGAISVFAAITPGDVHIAAIPMLAGGIPLVFD
jgi:hypothetical protein